LVRLLPQAEIPEEAAGLERYALVTLHRPSNVDAEGMLARILEVLGGIGRELPVLFPVHPRTRQRMEAFELRAAVPDGVCFLNPLPYLQCLALQRHATVVITDSGGIQEETTFLGVPCLTIRDNTERPVTVTRGTNVLIGHDMNRLRAEVDQILAGTWKPGQVPPLWDGHAAERIVEAIMNWGCQS
jgi:UDP-N-acetylglucosamine 2-epimerase (non-hydrolysing)